METWPIFFNTSIISECRLLRYVVQNALDRDSHQQATSDCVIPGAEGMEVADLRYVLRISLKVAMLFSATVALAYSRSSLYLAVVRVVAVTF